MGLPVHFLHLGGAPGAAERCSEPSLPSRLSLGPWGPVWVGPPALRPEVQSRRETEGWGLETRTDLPHAKTLLRPGPRFSLFL